MKKNIEDGDLFSMPEPEKDNKQMIKLLITMSVILGILFMVLFIASLLLKNVSVEEKLAFPTSGLSNSIFESQNGTYSSSEYLPYKRDFELSPYTIDVPSDNSADVGMGTSYTISGMDYAYVTEYAMSDKERRQVIIAEELGKAYILDLSLENCVMQEMSYEEGFLNGYEMHYITYAAQFSDAAGGYYIAYIQGYEVEVTEDMCVYFAISTTINTNEALLYYKDWLDTMALTLRYDDEVAKRLEAERLQAEAEMAEQEAQKAEEGEGEEETEEIPVDNAQSYYEQWYQSQHETVQIVADGSGTQKVECETESAYKSAVFTFVFTEPTEDLAYHMEDPDGTRIEMSDLKVTGDGKLTATFDVSDSKKGKYYIVFDKGGCTYTTPAFILDKHVVYTSDELEKLEMEENMQQESGVVTENSLENVENTTEQE